MSRARTITGTILNLAGVIPLAYLDTAWWVGWKWPARDALGDLARLSPLLITQGLKAMAIVTLAASLLTLLLWRRQGPSALQGTAHVTRPFFWGGLLAPAGLLPLFPITSLAPYLWFATLFAAGTRTVNAIRAITPDAPASRLTARRAGWLVFAVTLAVHLVAWYRITWPVRDGCRDYHLTGDQPSYLYMAESLIEDRDLDLSNNRLSPSTYQGEGATHASGVSRHNPGLSPDSPRYAALAERYGTGTWSVHRCGTSLLVAPAYWAGKQLGGWERRLVTLLLVLAMALGVREIVLAGFAFGIRPLAGLLMGLGLGCCVPVVCMSTAVYPEPFMFLAMSRLIRAALTRQDGLRHDLEAGVWMALAPWLQDKYLVWVLPFFAARALTAPSVRKSWPAMGLLPLLSAALYVRHNLFLYGQILPQNSLGTFLGIGESFSRGLTGLWLDDGYGLAVLVPVLLASAGGLILWWRESAATPRLRIPWWATLVALLAGWAVIGSWDCWHGGFAPPSRFALTLLPACALAAMVATAKLPGAPGNAAAVLWVISAVAGLECLTHTDMWYSRVYPAADVSRWLGLMPFQVNFEGFAPGRLWRNAALLAGILAGGAVAGYFACIAWKGAGANDGWRRKARLALYGILLGCGVTVGLARSPIRMGPRDFPTLLGIVRDARVEATAGAPVRFMAEIEFFRHLGNQPWAFSIQSRDTANRFLAQHDFDLRTYLNEWVFASDANRELYETRHRARLIRDLQLPPNTATLRVGLYNPATGKSARNLWRDKSHVIPVP